MDLREEISNYLDGKDYDDLTKIRFIYLYVCKKFSYDIRFLFAKDKLKDKIYNKKIDISNVQEYEIACYSYARILQDALALYGFNSEVIKERDGAYSHAYVKLVHKDYILKLDPTKRHDTTRVKMHSTTLDFSSLSNDEFFYDELFSADQNIIQDFGAMEEEQVYNNKTIVQLVNIIEQNAKERGLSEDELFFEKLEYLCSLINSRVDFERYDDMDYYLAYLIKKMKLNTINHIYVKPAVFFKNDDNEMNDIINIILVEYKDFPPLFYVLQKKDKHYNIREVYKDEALDILNNYESPLCQYYFLNKAELLKTSKSNLIV